VISVCSVRDWILFSRNARKSRRIHGRIKILKDSTSVAIYGDKGKNGVLLIATKP
jgi:TonB-dependent SusC/RagA subfamily outer membrane receptor